MGAGITRLGNLATRGLPVPRTPEAGADLSFPLFGAGPTSSWRKLLWGGGALCATFLLLYACALQRQSLRVAEAATRAAAIAAQPVPRAFYGKRLEPRASVVLHGGGPVDEGSFWRYSAALNSSRPMLAGSSVDLRDDLPGYFARLKGDLSRGQEAGQHDMLVPQIALSLTPQEATASHGNRSTASVEGRKVKELVSGLRSLDRPVFLLLGFGVNGTGYPPAAYVAVFRHVAKAIREAGLENVALVWEWSPDAELEIEEAGARQHDATDRWTAFYPGDDVVDWWGLDLFSEPGITSPVTAGFLTEADQRGFPVMIGESAPKGHDASEGDLVLDAWYRPCFKLIDKSRMIKGFSYVDQDWRAYPQWTTWGDARVEADPTVLQYVRSQMNQPLYANLAGRQRTEQLLGVK